MSKLVLDKNNLFIILTAVIFICVLLKEKNKIYKFIAAIPLFASCSYTFFSNYLIAMLPSSVGVIERFKQEQLVMGLNQINIVDLGVILGYIGIIIVILACFYIIFKKDIKFFICSGVLTLGFITRFIMALSPTIFASGERTFVFLYISFLICSCMVIEKIPKLNKEYFGKNWIE